MRSVLVRPVVDGGQGHHGGGEEDGDGGGDGQAAIRSARPIGVVALAGDDRFERAIPPDQSRETVAAATAREQAGRGLGLPEDRFFTAGIAQVGGQGEFVPSAPGPPADGGDTDERGVRQARGEGSTSESSRH